MAAGSAFPVPALERLPAAEASGNAALASNCLAYRAALKYSAAALDCLVLVVEVEVLGQ